MRSPRTRRPLRSTLGRLALLAVAALGPAACRGETPEPAAGRQAAARTLDGVRRHLTRDLTPALAEQRLGAPDERTGSGLIIYKYRLDADQTLWLGFPGYAPITYAKVEAADGSMRELTLP